MEWTLLHSNPCRALIIVGLFLALVSTQAAEQESGGGKILQPATATDFSGSLRATYDHRGHGSDQDSDAYGYWSLRGRNLGGQNLELYTSGQLRSDLDGNNDYFDGLYDASRHSDNRLYQLYLDVYDKDKEMLLRIGRQYVDVADYIQMDGAQAMLFDKSNLGGRIFLGQPVSEYSSVSGDLFGGISLSGRPWEGNFSRVTYSLYHDESEDASDDQINLDLRQQVQEDLNARGYLSLMNEDMRMGGIDLYYLPKSGVLVDALVGVRRWGDYDANTRAYSPLVTVLGDLEPSTTGFGRLTAEILQWLFLSPGAMLREPDHSDTSNKSFGRYDLSLIIEPDPALDVSVALEYWDVENGESFFGVSGDIRYSHGKLWELSLGAAYLDYTYFRQTDFNIAYDGPGGGFLYTGDGTRAEVSPDVFTYFLRGKWNISEKTALRLAGEIEDDSEDDDLGYRVRASFEVRL